MPEIDQANELSPHAGQGRVLRHEAKHARLAMTAAGSDLATHLKHAVEPGRLVKQHPLATTGIAAGLGLVAALIVVPSPTQQAAKRLRILERAARLEAKAATVKGGSSGGFGKRAFGFGFRMLKPMIVRSLLTAVTSAGGAAAGAKAVHEAETPDDSSPVDDVT
jgi:hypothetical protein